MYIQLDPQSEPMKVGESWWIVHPNDGEKEFNVPMGAAAHCIHTFGFFIQGENYKVVSNETDTGYITLAEKDDIVKMPYYVFARYFDAQSFIKTYRRTKSKPTQLTLFED